MKASTSNLAVFARLQILTKVNHRISNMSQRKIASRNIPVMSPKVATEVNDVLAQFTNRGKWVDWGMDTLRKQGNAVLLYGPPGTGKTKIAEYMSKRCDKGMCTINMKDVGGKAPGHTERMIDEKFREARVNGMQTIFFDECEAVVWDRGRAGSDSMWMVGVIDEILMQTAKYPGLIVFATNRDDIIDPALKSRCFACLQIGLPGFNERVKLWQIKMPTRFPLQLTVAQCEKLAEVELTGRQIENTIVHEASNAITANRKPNFTSLLKMAQKVHDQGE